MKQGRKHRRKDEGGSKKQRRKHWRTDDGGSRKQGRKHSRKDEQEAGKETQADRLKKKKGRKHRQTG
jgi:hypothetical protein